ncbi:hypothetical protein DFQ28_009031 [Apophysomyces sp. BC1034]|nr:hypothetical protein DFQ30_008708 [Apophysomyces sp. BC1015]KAG0173872.1 hypothetical protein DFQ29_007698 [Apophysomyces sp. BC1021]KAG0185651.1 hypothetical protein DFQ28_009031 [Apophysomyces sp. BC1034]
MGFIPSVPVTEDFVCYDFAASIPSHRLETIPTIDFHTFWSASGSTFSDRHLDALRSFFATQNETNTKLTLWIPPEDEQVLLASVAWQKITKHAANEHIHYKLAEWEKLTLETPFAPSLDTWKNSGYVGANDLVRLFVLYQYGGVWFDFGTLFVRDLTPILSKQEWIAQGDCHTSTGGNPFDKNMLRFQKHSPYLCEMLHEASTQLQGQQSYPSTHLASDNYFGSKLYYRIYRKLLKHHVKSWSVLPWCFTNPSECYGDNSVPRASSGSRYNRKRLEQVFAYHLHGPWLDKSGSIMNDLVNTHKKYVGW